MTVYIGIDLGGTTAKCLMMDGDHTIDTWSIPTDISENGSKIVPDLIASIQERCAQHSIALSAIGGIGMGTPGQVDVSAGTVMGAYNLNWATTQPVKAQFEKAFGVPFAIDNDANVAALGETVFGAGDNNSDVVMVTLGTGVGAGVVVNGRIVTGTAGAAGEIGHLCMDPSGKQCTCGNIGCLETITSATGIRQMALDYLAQTTTPSALREYTDIDAKVVFDLAKENDALALEIVEQFGKVLGLACSYVGNLLNPRVIVIGGGVCQAGQIVLDAVTPHFLAYSLEKVRQTTQLKLATLGSQAGALGAVALAKTLV